MRSLPKKRDRTTEDLVVGEVWREYGGLLSEQLSIPSERPRYLDGFIVQAPRRKLIGPTEVPALAGRRVWVIEVKSGEVDMGVLGQALFGAELVKRVHPEADVVPVAAAPLPPGDLLRALLEEFRPDRIEWRAYPKLRRPGRLEKSSPEPNPHELRESMLAWYAKDTPGRLVKIGKQRHPEDFTGIRVQGCEHTLSPLKLSALLLPDREPGFVHAREADLILRRGERAQLIHTCTDLYRTQMGKTLFGAELARRVLGLERAMGIALFARDNRVLHSLLDQYGATKPVHFPRASG